MAQHDIRVRPRVAPGPCPLSPVALLFNSFPLRSLAFLPSQISSRFNVSTLTFNLLSHLQPFSQHAPSGAFSVGMYWTSLDHSRSANLNFFINVHIRGNLLFTLSFLPSSSSHSHTDQHNLLDQQYNSSPCPDRQYDKRFGRNGSTIWPCYFR